MSKIIKKLIEEDGSFPNNPSLPVLHYQKAFSLDDKNNEKEIEEIFLKNMWYRPWVNGIYDFHHFHSNNHEVLGIADGNAEVLIGGENGVIFKLKKGDALVLPAGVSHKKIQSTSDFSVVGAYSIDVAYNMKYGKEDEKSEAIKKIKKLPLPNADPVFGVDGPLLKLWKK